MKQLFDGIYTDGKNFFTHNLNPGKKVYGEKLLISDGKEYRQWDAYRSKYGAALKNGLKENIFKNKGSVLYLGSAEGTTVSHVSDIVGKEGLIFCIDISEIAMMKLSKLSEIRENILPILGSAEKPQEYEEFIEEKVDALFQDISQRNQAELFVRNARFLKKGGLGAIAIKTKSISQSMKKEEVLAEEKKILASEFEILQVLTLEPFEKHHYLVLVKKK